MSVTAFARSILFSQEAPVPGSRRPLGRRLLDALAAWIFRPIDFPGKWPEVAPPREISDQEERYNRIAPSEPMQSNDQ
jgi:hypothetical protein